MPLTLREVLRNGTGAEEGLEGLRDVVISPDGSYAYSLGYRDDALAVFARDPDGVLTFLQVIAGLGGASALVVSPDGVHVYTAAADRGAITTFERGTDGRLTPVAEVVDGAGNVTGLAGVRALAIAADGRDLYAAGFAADSVVAFRRDPISGQLGFQQRLGGMTGAADVLVSDDGISVYVARYGDATIAVLGRDPATGMLNGLELERDGIGGVSGLAGVSALDLSPDGSRLYTVGTESMVVFARASFDGRLGFLEAKSWFADRIDCPASPSAAVAVGDEHRYIYAVRGLDAGIAVFERNPLNGIIVLRGVYGGEAGGRSCDGDNALAPARSASDDRQLYVSGGAADRLGVFAVDDGALGALTLVEEHRNGLGGVSGLTGANAIAASPDQRNLYVAAAPGALGVYDRSTVTGEIRFVEVLRDGVDGVTGLGAVSTVDVSADGLSVYVATAGDSLVVFRRDLTTGRLTFVQPLRNGVDGVDGLAGDSAVRVSPDAANVYVASEGDNAVAVFARDPGDGTLTFLEQQRQGEGGVDGIAEASALAISPGGEHVYVTGAAGSIAVFERNLGDGRLTFVTTYRNQVGGIDGLAGASAILASDDGTHVYVAGFLDAAIAIFVRNDATGELGFVNVQRDAAGESLTGVTALALGSGDERLYSASIGGALAVFARDAGLGSLRAIETYRDGVAGIDGLGGARSVVAIDGSVYVAGSTDGALAFFSVNE